MVKAAAKLSALPYPKQDSPPPDAAERRMRKARRKPTMVKTISSTAAKL